MRRCHAEDLALIVCRSTPSGDYLLHVAERFAITTIEVILPRPHEQFATWRVNGDTLAPSKPESHRLWLSPIVSNETSSRAVINGPLQDVVMIAIADFVHAVEVRKGGRIDRIIRHRLACSDFPVGSVAVDLPRPEEGLPSVNSPINSARELMGLGAIGWYRPSKHDLLSSVSSPMVDADVGAEKSIWTGGPRRSGFGNELISARAYSPLFARKMVQNGNADSQWTYLTHCTRSPDGPWPDQSTVGYYDEILTALDHSHPLDTLIRILKQQRLIATNHLKRTSVQTVSLSQVRLTELLSRRQFQRHLHRWDWLPYGICIKRQYLEQIGCRPVVYGTRPDMEKLAEEELPFFQLLNSEYLGDSLVNSSGESWDRELEWRIPNDIRLADIPATEAFVFVPTSEEGLRVSSISRFPVMIVGSCTDPKHLS